MRTDKIQTYNNGVDVGYLGDNQTWWFDPSFEHSFTIFDLDTFYPDAYFENDHVGVETVQNYVNYVLEYGRLLLGRDVQSVLEIGCAGGWFTNEFIKRGIDIIAVEGTIAGVAKAIKRGVPPEMVIKHDLRQPWHLNRKFDVVLCTEVAEHIECPFSSQLVNNLVRHADFVWFSFEEPGTNEAAYHHCNEQPVKFWRNLFRYYNFRMLPLPPTVITAVETRGKCICCAETLQVPSTIVDTSTETEPVLIGLGKGQDVCQSSSQNSWKHTLKKFIPPILIDAVKSAHHYIQK